MDSKIVGIQESEIEISIFLMSYLCISPELLIGDLEL